MATWYPGAMNYWQWCQANSFLNDFKSQSNQIRNSIHEQTRAISDQTKEIVASNDQMALALENGYNRLSEMNERGFDQVTSSVEAMHSDLSYALGILIQKVEFQNRLLNSIHHTLQTPSETQVKELYENGCKFIRQENIEAAVECFKESISLRLGKYYFPSYYQLGRLYISGKLETINIIDPKIAMEYLLKANELGNGIVRENASFKPILSDCKFFLSQTYYFQLTGGNSNNEIELLNKAIKHGEEAVSLNPNLSQGYYHLAKYYSYSNEVSKLLLNLGKAIEIYRDYSFKYDEDKVFEKHKIQIITFLDKLKEQKRKSVEPELREAKSYIAALELKGISQFQNLKIEYKLFKDNISFAELDFRTGTYFGFDDCHKKLDNNIKGKFEEFGKKLDLEFLVKRATGRGEAALRRASILTKVSSTSVGIFIGIPLGIVAYIIFSNLTEDYNLFKPSKDIGLAVSVLFSIAGAAIGGYSGYMISQRSKRKP